MKNKITNIEELQAEIARLKTMKMEQEAYLEHQFGLLKDKINKPVHFFQNMFSFLPNTASLFGNIGTKGGAFQGDWLTKSLRIGLPFLVNRVFFRKAGYFKRILMGLLSSQAAGFFNKERLAQGIDAVTSWIKKSSKKGKSAKPSNRNRRDYDFGIPPDSETY
ncbi:hypothetical protein RYH73_00650 [Olivibacter sp. CPCC 100613]|uniref:hypothetical protein n=1 Tax=Olivibacter sp. CPCC 100613 TaxID=3079931 RepID=UPI002FF66FF0